MTGFYMKFNSGLEETSGMKSVNEFWKRKTILSVRKYLKISFANKKP